MSFWQDKKKRKIFIWLTSIFLALALLVGACAIYLSKYYHADEEAIAEFAPEMTVTQEEWEDGTLVYKPENAVAGLIFYPGGKVEHTAYIPLMKACASRGIVCVLIEMPFNLAVFDSKAADGVREKFPQIESWFIGGHSLGGAMAAAYLEKNADDFAGLVLLGAYSTKDLSNTHLRVLSIYGGEDKVLNKEKYEKNKKNLPTDFIEVVIEGGCHAYFGMYGKQEGDGTPTITNEEQILYTAEQIIAFVAGTPRLL